MHLVAIWCSTEMSASMPTGPDHYQDELDSYQRLQMGQKVDRIYGKALKMMLASESYMKAISTGRLVRKD